MTERKWTTEQLQAITERGKNILVSAGAGSGKTAVMIERVTRLIMEDRVPVSAMLIVTFTEAAASEMRERLRVALKDRLAETIAGGDAGEKREEQEWIRKQLDDLHSAQISTFHSFAQRTIKEFFYLTELEPGFRVLDEAEAEVVKDEALEELFDSEYEENKDDFRAFMDSYSGEKNDSEARQIILQLYRKLETIPDGMDVLDEKIEELGQDKDTFLRSAAAGEFAELCRRELSTALEEAGKAENILRDEELERMADVVKQDKAYIEEALGLLGGDGKAGVDLEKAVGVIKAVPFATLGANKKAEKEAYEPIKGIIKLFHDSYKARVQALLKIYYSDMETMTKVMNMTVPYARTLSRLIRRFDRLFREMKNELKGIDYSDMEHFAYQILQHSEAADYYRDLFQYIFIDEYQDTNYMQETIAGLISRPDNVFMVGDIKQSIYHFRLADPEIFQGKYDKYKRIIQDAAKAGTEPACIKIDLNKNFRSKPPVIHEINEMFRPLMDGYDKDAELVCGVEAGEHALPDPKTYIVDRTAEETDDDPAEDGGTVAAAVGSADGTAAPAKSASSKSASPDMDAGDPEIEDIKKEELEARQAVRIIRENLGKEYTDPTNGETRKLEYRDIVILMRSFKRSAEGYRKAFREAGIPLYIDDKDGYFDTIEINVALALLRVIDNKRQDVPFIALLRSEIFGFTCEELAMIRKLHRQGSYVEAAEAVAGYGELADDGTGVVEVKTGAVDGRQTGSAACSGDVPEELRVKVKHVFDEIKKWQTYAVTLPISDMIWRILNETGYYVIAGTFPNGAARQANLRLLADRAREYQERSLGSLYGFILYIDRLKSSKVEMAQATLFSENENVVRIMTIHHSKGLEFPVVILASMDNNPRRNDSGTVMFDRETGLGLRAKDPVRHLREDTFILRVIKAKEKRAEVAELQRVFYVAVTRARETFYLLGAAYYDDLMEALESGKYSDSTLFRMSRYLPEVERVSGAELISMSLQPEDDDAVSKASGETSKSQRSSADDKLQKSDADDKLQKSDADDKRQKSSADDKRQKSDADDKLQKSSADDKRQKSDADYADIIARLDYRYPYSAARDLAAKTSVTGLNQAKMRKAEITGPGEGIQDPGLLISPDVPGMDDDIATDHDDKAPVIQLAENDDNALSDAVPSFISDDQKITAAKTGTIYHKIMEKLDFVKAKEEGFRYIARVAAEMVQDGLYTEEEVKTVDLGRIGHFFDTDLGGRCIEASRASMLYKEQTFESKIAIEGEDVLVQGVIDCYFEEQDGVVLIDYKTNRIDRSKSLDEEKTRIREMYSTQLDLYAEAIEKATGRKVKEKYLYLFAIGEAITV